MAAPVDSARVGTNITTAATSHSINVGSPAAGNLQIVLVRFAAAPGTVTFTGYTLLVTDSSDATDDTTSIYYRDADGTEGATDTLGTTNSVKLCALAWVVTGAETAARSIPAVSAVAVGTTAANTASPNSVAPLGAPRDTLYIAMMGLDGEGNAPTASPTNYSAITTANSGTGGAVATNCSIGGGSRQISASSSDDAGTFTHAAATTGWTAFAVAIHEPFYTVAQDVNRAVTDTGSVSINNPAFNVPSGVRVGELLVLMWRAGGEINSITSQGGFSQLVLSEIDGSDDYLYVGYKVADGTEGATITQTVMQGRRFAGIMYRIVNGGTPTISAVGTGSGTSVDPASYTPAGGTAYYLWIPIGSCEDARTVSVFPTGFVNGAQENVSTLGEGATIMSASKQQEATSLNPGAFTITVTSNNHMTATVVVPYEQDPGLIRHPAHDYGSVTSF